MATTMNTGTITITKCFCSYNYILLLLNYYSYRKVGPPPEDLGLPRMVRSSARSQAQRSLKVCSAEDSAYP